MTDLTVFRVYEPHELKNGRYPFAWDHLTCPDCHGSGEIGFNPSPINDPQCADSAPCGTCAGDGALDHGIKDLVREEAGHRCIRCHHPFLVGESGEFEREARDSEVYGLPAHVSFDGLPEVRMAAQRGRGTHWSPCDERCEHGDENVRWRNRMGEWTTVPLNIDADAEQQAAWRILTVHHLNERKFDCRWHNLVALCQRCHLIIQNKVEMNQVWPLEHSDWFKPYAAAFYAYSYLGQELTREQTMERLDELLGLERVA